jgi:predicted MPP superfamily phosphohydrolase
LEKIYIIYRAFFTLLLSGADFMDIFTVILIIVSVLAFIIINYYIGNTGWKYYASKITSLNIRLYWFTFILLSLTYVLPLIPADYMPVSIRNIMSKIGVYWLSIILYSFVFFLIADILYLFIGRMRKKRYLFSREKVNDTVLHNIAMIIIIFILSYGIYRAYFPAVTHYDIAINKTPRNIKSLHIVLVSDIHVGNIVGKSNLTRMVKKVNSLKPDMIVLCGDIINNSSIDFSTENADEILKGFNAKYGVYAVPGNHDYYDKNDMESKLQCYRSSNITLLRDKYARIANSIYLIGRDDIDSKIITVKDRKTIPELLNGIDYNLPVILLDHQPKDIENAEKNGVDLQLSGHTHGGQTFISSILSNKVYHEFIYGMFKENDLNVIVTSGLGTWGIPMRTGSRSEIVDINVKINR